MKPTDTHMHTKTHTHTHCSVSHKGPHGNTAFRSPVALFMQRCITIGPSHRPALQKEPAAQESLPASHTSSFSLFSSLTRPSAHAFPPPPSPSVLPSSAFSVSTIAGRKGGNFEERREQQTVRKDVSNRMNGGLHSKQRTHADIETC